MTPPEHDAEWETPGAEGRAVCDPTDRKCRERANPQTQKADGRLGQGAGKGEGRGGGVSLAGGTDLPELD